jgi:hypothetical protein
MGKKIVSSSNLLPLRQEIFLCGDVLKGQHVMLIKWENFGAFLSQLLRREIFLTGDFLNEFYCAFLDFQCSDFYLCFIDRRNADPTRAGIA